MTTPGVTATSSLLQPSSHSKAGGGVSMTSQLGVGGASHGGGGVLSEEDIDLDDDDDESMETCSSGLFIFIYSSHI